MLITTIQTTNRRLTLTAVNAVQANGDRFGLGRMLVEPPAESSLSQGRTFLPPLPFPDQKAGRKDDGDPTRYPQSPAPAGPVGSVPGSPVCRTDLLVTPTLLVGAEAAALTLESKLDPFGRRRDCQSPPARTVRHTDRKADASWPQVRAGAPTAASQ